MNNPKKGRQYWAVIPQNPTDPPIIRYAKVQKDVKDGGQTLIRYPFPTMPHRYMTHTLHKSYLFERQEQARRLAAKLLRRKIAGLKQITSEMQKMEILMDTDAEKKERVELLNTLTEEVTASVKDLVNAWPGDLSILLTKLDSGIGRRTLRELVNSRIAREFSRWMEDKEKKGEEGAEG